MPNSGFEQGLLSTMIIYMKHRTLRVFGLFITTEILCCTTDPRNYSRETVGTQIKSKSSSGDDKVVAFEKLGCISNQMPSKSTRYFQRVKVLYQYSVSFVHFAKFSCELKQPSGQTSFMKLQWTRFGQQSYINFHQDANFLRISASS